MKVMQPESNALLESNAPVYFIINNLSYYSLSKEQLLKVSLYPLSEEQKSFRRRLQAAQRARSFRSAQAGDERFLAQQRQYVKNYRVKR